MKSMPKIISGMFIVLQPIRCVMKLQQTARVIELKMKLKIKTWLEQNFTFELFFCSIQQNIILICCLCIGSEIEKEWQFHYLLLVELRIFIIWLPLYVRSDWLLSGHYFLVMTGHYENFFSARRFFELWVKATSEGAKTTKNADKI